MLETFKKVLMVIGAIDVVLAGALLGVYAYDYIKGYCGFDDFADLEDDDE